MKSIKLWRTFREGVESYRRNGWLTIAAVSILSLSLFIVGFTALIGFSGRLGVHNLERKISISVNFSTETPESRILALRDELSGFREISSVEYVSREQALEDFLSDGDQVIADAVAAVGENPLLSSLVVRAVDPRDYDLIAGKIADSEYAADIEQVNYERNRKKIQDLDNLTDRVRTVGLVIGGLFIAISVLITFNTVRLTIYSLRQEFEVMRLVGASNLHIRAPIFFEGLFYGLTSALVSLLLLTAAAYAFAGNEGPFVVEALNGSDFFGFYLSLLWIFVPMAIILGILLGVVSSLIAIRRYLKV